MLQNIVPASYNFQPSPLPVMSQTAQSEPAIGRMPAASVAATITVPPTEDNSRGAVAMRLGANIQLNQTAPATPTPLPANGNLPQGNSNAFMAQLFGQSEEGELAQLSGLFSAPAPRLGDYNTLLHFSQTKYMPSQAALPLPQPEARKFIPVSSPASAPVGDSEPQVPQPSQQAGNAPVMQRFMADISLPQQPPAVPSSAVVTVPIPKAEIRPPAVKDSAPSAKKDDTSSSLIAPRGFKAYVASTVRAAQHLLPKAPQAVTVAM